jgi:hypothetical protein
MILIIKHYFSLILNCIKLSVNQTLKVMMPIGSNPEPEPSEPKLEKV